MQIVFRYIRDQLCHKLRKSLVDGIHGHETNYLEDSYSVTAPLALGVWDLDSWISTQYVNLMDMVTVGLEPS